MKQILSLSQKLAKILSKLQRLAIAFSGGYDSSFLAKFAELTLGRENVFLIHVRSQFSPWSDRIAVAKFAKKYRMPVAMIDFNPLRGRNISFNPPDRCYQCKKKIMRLVIAEGRKAGFANFADGTNLDDIFQDRPGFRATEELGIIHPLLDAGIGKKAIATIAENLKIDISFAPSSSCLATRIPFGTKITNEKLGMIDQAEKLLCEFRVPFSRVRIVEKNAFIEANPQYFGDIIRHRGKVVAKFKKIGFEKIFLDIQGRL
jgi:uncharacterized protein